MPTLTLAFKGNTLQVIPLHDGLMTIGRDPSCFIHIDSLAVSPQHGHLLLHDGECILHSNSGQETYVNHKPVTDEKSLQDNDLIRIGKHTLRYTNASKPLHEVNHSTFETPAKVADTPAPAARVNGKKHNACVQVLSGSHLGKTIKLRSGMTDLGKAGIAPALVSLRRDGYYIANLGEDDNLSVGDENIGAKTWPLKDGDLIQIDKLKLQFHLEQ